LHLKFGFNAGGGAATFGKEAMHVWVEYNVFHEALVNDGGDEFP